MPDRRVGSNLRSTRVNDYQERIRELTEAFNLPPDVRVWATVRFDPDSDDEALKNRVTVAAQAGRTVTSVEVEGTGELTQVLRGIIRDNREAVLGQLKADLAVNLMAGINEVP